MATTSLYLVKNQEEIRLNFCKKCNNSIENGMLCGYGCEYDNTYIDERLPEMVEVRVYKFDHTEPYVKSK